MNIFAALNAIEMQKYVLQMSMFFKCVEIIAMKSQEIPIRDLIEWSTRTNHFCLPISVSKVMPHEELIKEFEFPELQTNDSPTK